MTELEKIDEHIEVLEKIIKEKDRKWFGDKRNDNKSLEDYWAYVYDEKIELSKLDRKRRMIMPYELSELSTFGNVMSIKEFIGACRATLFIDSDGFGKYVKDGKETDIEIYPSDIKHNAIRREFDTIIWFNK